jgi:hypothetical protein
MKVASDQLTVTYNRFNAYPYINANIATISKEPAPKEQTLYFRTGLVGKMKSLSGN